MKELAGIGLPDVQQVYSGPEGELWELLMGQQIHVGGFASSLDLAEKAGIGPGMSGVDLCCCTGAGMRFLVRFRGVARMHGVDATPAPIERGRCRTVAEGLAERITFTLADACDTGLPDEAADFVWGEDAWCYVVHKDRLIAEAVRLVRPGGVIAFTDWIEGRPAMTADEARRFLAFMKFPSIEDLEGYSRLLADCGCDVLRAEDTGRFAPCMDLYLDMVQRQLTYDALRILGFDVARLEALAGEMQFLRDLVHAGKVCQGLLVARKRM
jgi:SAM-dependent methyltransferase